MKQYKRVLDKTYLMFVNNKVIFIFKLAYKFNEN